MGAGEDALAWKNKQPNREDYDVIGPEIYKNRTKLEPNPVWVFIQKGERGILNLGENPYYAEDGDQDFKVVGSLSCSAEGGAVVAYVVKKS